MTTMNGEDPALPLGDDDSQDAAAATRARIAHELIHYNPAADEHGGAQIYNVWASELAFFAPPVPAADCYHRAAPNEPRFTLLGRDPHAAVLVNLWAIMRRIEADPDDQAKIENAELIANQMAEWVMGQYGRDPVGVAGLAIAVAAFAETVGAVITMGTEPLEPLAMGNYRPTVSVRMKRERAEPIAPATPPVTAELVMQLRDMTDCPTMQCKAALIVTRGSLSDAEKLLRTSTRNLAAGHL